MKARAIHSDIIILLHWVDRRVRVCMTQLSDQGRQRDALSAESRPIRYRKQDLLLASCAFIMGHQGDESCAHSEWWCQEVQLGILPEICAQSLGRLQRL